MQVFENQNLNERNTAMKAKMAFLFSVVFLVSLGAKDYNQWFEAFTKYDIPVFGKSFLLVQLPESSRLYRIINSSYIEKGNGNNAPTNQVVIWKYNNSLVGKNEDEAIKYIQNAPNPGTMSFIISFGLPQNNFIYEVIVTDDFSKYTLSASEDSINKYMGAIMKNTDGSFHSSNINYHLNSNFKSLTTDSKNIANLKAAANLLDLIPQSDENYSSFKNQLSGSQSSNIDQSINEIEDLLKSYYKNILNNAHPLKIQVTKDKLRIDQEANVIADRFNSVKTLIDNSSNITDELRSKFNMLEKECNNLDNEVLSAYIKMYTDAIDFCSSESFKHYYLEGNTLNLLLKNRPFSDPNEYITLINNLKPIIPDEILSKNEQAFAKCQVMIKQYNDNQSKEKLAEEMAPLEDDMIATAHNVIMLYFQEKEARQRGYSTVANDLKQQHRDNLQKLCNYKRDYITKYGVSEYNKFYKKALSNEAHMVPDAQAKIHFSISYDLCK